MPAAATAFASWVGNVVLQVATSLGASGYAATTAYNLAVTTAYTLATSVAQAALLTGLQYVVDDVSRQKAGPQGSELQLRIDSDMAREMIIGERVTAGSLVARYSQDTNLQHAHFVFQVADHPCVELSKVYGDGRLIRSTPLTHGTRTEITAYSYSGGARVWMTWHDGRPGQAADSYLVTKSATDPDVVAGQILGWTSNHKGAGCAYVYVEVAYDSDILTSIPDFKFHVKGAKLYDRRKDTTAGGSGTHRLDDPSTWEYSTNAAVATDHYILGYQVEDDPLAFGIGLSPHEVPYEQFAALADLADEDVDTGTGGGAETIKRYAVNGIISTADAFEDVLETFQNQMAARIVDLGGRIGILGAEERSSVVSLTDNDWASDEAVRFADKLAFSELYGAVAGSFPDPNNLYQPTPYEKQVTDYLALPDGGEATTAQLDLPFEVHPRRAVRLASAWIRRESLQPRLIGTFATRSLAWKLEAGDWFDLTSTRLQLTAELFEVIDIVKHDDFTVTITARAIDPDFLAFDTDEDPDLSVPPAVDPLDLLLDEPSGTITAIALTGGAATEPAIRFTLTSAPVPTREVVIEVQEWSGSVLTGDPIITTMHSDEGTKLIRSGVVPTKQYKARAKARIGQRESPWTAWSSAITASSTYTTPTSGLATAIVGQGDLATTNASALPFGINVAVNTTFGTSSVSSALGWTYSAGNTGLTPSSAVRTGARNSFEVSLSGTPGGTFFVALLTGDQTLAGLARFAAPCVAGDRIGVSALFAHNSTVAAIRLSIVWYDASGSYISEESPSSVTNVADGSTGNPANFSPVSLVGVAPTNARYAVLYAYASISGGANPKTWVMSPLLARLPVGQTAVPQYTCGLPDRLSDRSLENTAAAISGQGWGATASEAMARAGRSIGVLKNARFEEYFTGTAVPPQWGNWTNGSGTFAARTLGDGYGFVLAGGAATENGIVQQRDGIKPSTDYLLICEIKRTTGSLTAAGVLIQYLNSGGTFLEDDNLDFAVDASSDGVVSTTPDGITRFEKVITTDPSTARVNIYAMNHWTGFGSVASANGIEWCLVDLIPMSLIRELRADVTGNNTAPSITGQGNFATNNFYVQTSAPSSPVDGWWWADTTAGQLKVRVSGAWVVVAEISTGGAGFDAYISSETNGVFVTAPDTANVSCSITASGGTGGYSYLWERIGAADGFTPGALNTSSMALSQFFGTGGAGASETWRCTITDGDGRSIFVTILFVAGSV